MSESQENNHLEALLQYQLGNAINLRSAQDQVLWTVASLFVAAQGVLLVALFQNGASPSPGLGLTVSLVGFFASLGWLVSQERALSLILRHEDLIRRIEERLRIPSKYAVSQSIGVTSPPKIPRLLVKPLPEFLERRLPERGILLLFAPFAASITWLGACGYFAFMNVCAC